MKPMMPHVHHPDSPVGMTPATWPIAPWRGGWRDGLRYGAPGLPLAFAALPLYVLLPPHYAGLGVPLAWLGVALLASRLFDAVIDPWIGRFLDAALMRGPGYWAKLTGLAGVLMVVGFAALFFPPPSAANGLLVWCVVSLVITTSAYSLLTVAHQAWGARLGGGPAQRAQVVAWREGLALAGVMVACVLPTALGLGATVVFFGVSLVAALALWSAGPKPLVEAAPPQLLEQVSPWAQPDFVRLAAVFLPSALAGALAAGQVLFFIRDGIQAGELVAAYLFTYFACAALGLPLWLRAVRLLGLARAWCLGLVLSVLGFAAVPLLVAGDRMAFGAVCAATGLALGADLALPGALLAGVIQRAGHAGTREGAYMGWWTMGNKFALALAAGAALPALQALGYTPGGPPEIALSALGWTYGVLPCALKLLAAALLWFFWIRPQKEQ